MQRGLQQSVAGGRRWRAFAAAACSWLLTAVGCGSDSSEHRHEPGSHGGIIVAVGQDHHHAEALFEPGGVVKLFMLDHDQSQVLTVPKQELTAYIRAMGRSTSIKIQLIPEPQTGDAPGQTSLFIGKMPPDLVGRQFVVVVPSIQIGEQRYRFSFTSEEDHDGPPMPVKVTDDAERELYLVPGGQYTESDIAANGRVTASEKYRDFRSVHDRDPKAGDRVCPITGTKANPACTWTIGGEEYQFCCPPCIDEFVSRAKTEPDEIKKAADYTR